MAVGQITGVGPQVATTGNPGSGQVTQASVAKTTQRSFRQLQGEVQQWNPDAPPTMVALWINNAYRKMIDSRTWYGNLVKGQITVPQSVTTGSVALTQGSLIVTGIGTAWDATLIGRQFRAGLTNPTYTIVGVDAVGQTLTLDLPWGGNSASATAYQIFQSIVSFGYNVKYLLSVINPRLSGRCAVNMPQELLNERDPNRSAMGFTRAVFNYPASADGQPQYELWPAPTTLQSFPFLAYVQPPDMVNDDDAPASFLRSDLIVLPAIANALLFRGRQSKYYDPQTAGLKLQEYERELEKLQQADNKLFQKDLMWDYTRYPQMSMGGDYEQSHDCD